MTKEQAILALSDLRDARMQTVCPLLKGNCKLNCECLILAEIICKEVERRLSDGSIGWVKEYEIKGGWCNCFALKGKEGV